MTDKLIRLSDALALFKLPYQLLAKFEVEALPTVTVGVKPLVWEETYEKVPKSAWASHTGFGRWFIVLEFLGMNHAVYRLHEVDYPTLDAAKAAAQRDYETRILAALEPVAAPDPICDHCGMDPAAIREAALREAAALMAVAAENCRKQFTYPPKTKEQRDYQTGAIIHSNAAAAILALIPTKGAAE